MFNKKFTTKDDIKRPLIKGAFSIYSDCKTTLYV